jgi:hypothetical protein
VDTKPPAVLRKRGQINMAQRTNKQTKQRPQASLEAQGNC